MTVETVGLVTRGWPGAPEIALSVIDLLRTRYRYTARSLALQHTFFESSFVMVCEQLRDLGACSLSCSAPGAERCTLTKIAAANGMRYANQPIARFLFFATRDKTSRRLFTLVTAVTEGVIAVSGGPQRPFTF